MYENEDHLQYLFILIFYLIHHTYVLKLFNFWKKSHLRTRNWDWGWADHD